MALLNMLGYFFNDKNWIKKFLVGCLLIFPSIIASLCNPSFYAMKYALALNWIEHSTAIILMLVFSLIAFFCGIASSGYIGLNSNLRIYKKDADLPSWSDLKDILKTGIKINVAFWIYVFLLGIVYFCILLVSLILVSIFIKGGIWVIFPVAFKVTNIITIILGYFTFFTSMIAFSTDLRLKSFFNYKLILNIVKQNKKGYCLYIISCIFVSFLLMIINWAALNKYLIFLVFVPFYSFYFALVFSELLAQIFRVDNIELDS